MIFWNDLKNKFSKLLLLYFQRKKCIFKECSENSYTELIFKIIFLKHKYVKLKFMAFGFHFK